jgi:hypothetical protein
MDLIHINYHLLSNRIISILKIDKNMENHCLQSGSITETHPYAYLTLLNNLYAYYDLDGKKHINKT